MSNVIHSLTQHFSNLPGLGPKSAGRIVYYLLRRPASRTHELGELLLTLHRAVQPCSLCFAYEEIASGATTCRRCADTRRDKTVLCVVAESQDIAVIESSKGFYGMYHVLGGLLNPLEGITGSDITVNELRSRVETSTDLKEVVLALDATMEGETTLLYIKKLLAPYVERGLVVSRLARGLPTNASIQYADDLTLEDALKGRKAL